MIGEARDGREWAFTLLELLTVIAIVAILAAILIPSVNAAKVSANKARTRVQFSQWAAAIESFRSEYGFYPSFHGSHLVNGGAAGAEHPFHDVVAGRRRDGSALADGSAAAVQNRKRISFYGFGESEFTDAASATPNLLCDAFGNVEIAVLVDRNLDGVVNVDDYGGSLPIVRGMRPTTEDFPATGLRVGVAFYAPAPRGSAEAPAFIFSWK